MAIERGGSNAIHTFAKRRARVDSRDKTGGKRAVHSCDTPGASGKQHRIALSSIWKRWISVCCRLSTCRETFSARCRLFRLGHHVGCSLRSRRLSPTITEVMVRDAMDLTTFLNARGAGAGIMFRRTSKHAGSRVSGPMPTKPSADSTRPEIPPNKPTQRADG